MGTGGRVGHGGQSTIVVQPDVAVVLGRVDDHTKANSLAHRQLLGPDDVVVADSAVGIRLGAEAAIMRRVSYLVPI